VSLRLAVAGAFRDPIVVRESRTRGRLLATPIALTVSLGLVAGVAIVVFGLAAAGAPDHRPNAAQMGRAAYHVMSLQLGLVVLLGPALAAASISRERERRTFDLLLVSDLTPWSIVRAKALSIVSYLMLFVVAALPLYVAFFLHAGLNLGDLVVAELLSLAAAVAAVSLGLFLSALCSRTGTATMAATGLALALCLDVVLAGVVPVPGTGLPQTRRQLVDGSFGVEVPFNDEASQAAGGTAAAPVHPVRLANPLYALHAQVAAPPGRSGSVSVGQLGRSLIPGGEGRSDWGLRVRPWHLSVLAVALSSLLLLAGATKVVGERRAPTSAPRRRKPPATA